MPAGPHFPVSVTGGGNPNLEKVGSIDTFSKSGDKHRYQGDEKCFVNYRWVYQFCCHLHLI